MNLETTPGKAQEEIIAETMETVKKIAAEVNAHPVGKEFEGLYLYKLHNKCLIIADYNREVLFETPAVENAAEKIKFLRYAIALLSIQEWIDGKFRTGRGEDIPEELHSYLNGGR